MNGATFDPADYSPAFLEAIRFVLPHEEEFVRGHWGDESFVITENVPGDSGGQTKWGIDAASHPGVSITALTKDDAVAIYWQEWLVHRLDLLPDKIAVASFDVWVNGGRAVEWLQTALNEIGQLDPPLAVDGHLGPLSYAAVASCNVVSVVKYFLRERDDRFELLAQNPARAKFLAGWEQRDADLRAYLA